VTAGWSGRAVDYRSRPDEAGMARHERAIQRASFAALAVTVAGFAAAYLVLPLVFAFPAGLAERLAFAIQASVFVLLWIMVGVFMVSSTRRFSPEDIGGAAAGPPSERLAIKSAFLQNTLEQAILAAGAYLALAAVAGGAWLALIPVAIILFAVGRILFYRGYRGGAAGRSLGMTLTLIPTGLIYLLVLGTMAGRLV
jgi:hypothetical protein